LYYYYAYSKEGTAAMNAPWPFRRKTEDLDPSNLPQEVRDYYQAQSSGRKGIAIMIGVASLIVTVLLALSIFYGGRWVYRHSFGKPKNTATQQTTEQQKNGGTPEFEQQPPGSNQNTPTDSGQSNTQPATGDNASPATSPADRLVNTGPDEDL
jgi:hypothetical protein